MFFNAETQSRRVAEIGFREHLGLFLATKITKATKLFVNSVSFVAKEFSLRLCVSALVFFCVGLFALAGEVPLSRVGGEAVAVADAARVAAKGGYAIRDAESAERALHDAEDFALLVAAARREGLFDDPEIMQTIRSLAVQKLLANKSSAVKPAEPDETAARAWYEANRAEFTRPAVCRGRVLEIAKSAKDWPLRRDGAAALLATNSPAAFGAAVRAWSTDAAARANTGRTTWLTEGKDNRRYAPEVVAALFEQKQDGTVAGPIETDRAIFWVQRTELRSGSVTPFEAARPGIARRMEQQARREAYAMFVEDLRKAATIERAENAAATLLEAARGESQPPVGPGPATAR